MRSCTAWVSSVRGGRGLLALPNGHGLTPTEQLPCPPLKAKALPGVKATQVGLVLRAYHWYGLVRTTWYGEVEP